MRKDLNYIPKLGYRRLLALSTDLEEVPPSTTNDLVISSCPVSETYGLHLDKMERIYT